MAEKDLTKQLTKLIKAGDKLVQDVEKGVRAIVGTVRDIKDSFPKKDTPGKPKDD